MAVYTKVDARELREFLSGYDIGALITHEEIAAGVSNTNYFVTTDQGKFVLTLFEPHRVNAEDIPFFMNYVVCLQNHDVACPDVKMRRDGGFYATLNNRPAAIFSFLKGEGASTATLNAARCRAAGALLAEMHQAAEDYTAQATNHFGPQKWQGWVHMIGRHKDDLDDILRQWPADLPRGAIHGDYFPDNVFFDGNVVTGVIDFHFTATDFYAFDLAIALNAWSFDEKNEFDGERFMALLEGYESRRALSEAEKEAMPTLLRGAALRFLLSRLEEKINWTPDRVGKPHDPNVFLKRLEHFSS